ncbi:MAG: thioredoxin-dependent thiol peroxidase, partial [Candidatus Caenarcaniphilales bacterium]|nr:thioredoxin-dependent thiol peroxidase [Candidatus Caenarcaniphilales bacterium]
MLGKKIEVGDKAPSFKSIAVGGEYGPEGKEVSLDDFKGKNLVLYFYPKDDTPGCTKQACGLRDNWKTLQSKAAIFGVSIDSVAKHNKFIEKYELPFALLSDEDKSLVEAFGVWVEKSMYGKKYMGTERTTFVISPDGKIKAIFPKVKPDEHV